MKAILSILDVNSLIISTSQMLEKIERIAKIVGVTVAIFGVYKYYDSLEQEKINRTIMYFDEYHKGEIFLSRKYIGEMSYEWLQLRNEDGSLLSHQHLSQVIYSDLNSKKNNVRVDIVLEFFDRLLVCSNNNGCDRNVASKFFKEEAKQFGVLIAPLISKRQENNVDYAKGLICIATDSNCE